MKEKIECIAALEEYKQLFTDFFCNPKPRSVKVTRSFNIGEEKEILSTFTLEENEFHNDKPVIFGIDISSLFISYMKKDGKKIKIYCDDFLVGIFYLPKQIQIEFVIHYMKSYHYHMVDINQILINRIVEKEKKGLDYELKVLPKREGSLRARIRIWTKDYKKNIERILFYGKIYSYLEIIFEEEVGSVSLCINGLYLFEISRIKLDERDIQIFLSRKKEQNQKKYGIGIRYGEKRIRIYKKHEMIYIVCPPDQGDDINGGMLPISNKENLDVGYSTYQ